MLPPAARIEQAARVERGLDLVVNVDGRVVELVCEPVALEYADAVLAGHGAATGECGAADLLGNRDGVIAGGLAAVAEYEYRVEVAVACVADGGDADIRAARDLLDFPQHLGQP